MKNLQFYRINLSNVRKLWTEIQQQYAVRSEYIPGITQVLYDTFDWRLFHKNLTLVREENILCLSGIETLEPSQKISWPRKTQPKFWWHFPEGSMKDTLKPLLDVRALLALVTFQKKRRMVSILNEDDKTIIKIHHDHIHLKDVSQRDRNFHALVLEPIRGYEKDLHRFQEFLKAQGVAESEESIYLKLVKAAGRTPGDYTSKFRLDLRPDLQSDRAMRMILRYLIDVMKSNESGIKADIDTEFLHDFRVSSRRIRSALALIKGVFPKARSDQFRQDFSILGKTTNRLRDLDVYLLKKDQYRAFLPQHTVAGLDPFFRDLAEERGAELIKVKKFLSSSTYRGLIARWDEYIESEVAYPAEEAKNARLPVLELAQKFIFRRYKKVIRDGKRIQDDSPDEQLHRLRIDCKRLRYLLEFFTSLFPREDVLLLIGQLKKLQDNLGEFNDLFMQQEQMRGYLNQVKKNRRDALLTAAAIGGLITVLSQRQLSVRSEFKKRFKVFCDKENLVMFTKLFRPQSKEGAKG